MFPVPFERLINVDDAHLWRVVSIAFKLHWVLSPSSYGEVNFEVVLYDLVVSLFQVIHYGLDLYLIRNASKLFFHVYGLFKNLIKELLRWAFLNKLFDAEILNSWISFTDRILQLERVRNLLPNLIENVFKFLSELTDKFLLGDLKLETDTSVADY